MTQSPQTITIQESFALLDHLRQLTGTTKQKKRGLRNFTMALLMLETGIRVGELVKLTRSDLFWNTDPVNTIIIRPQIAKTKQQRHIPVSTRLTEALKNYLNTYDPLNDIFDASFAFYTISPDHPLTTRQVERIIGDAAQKAFGRRVYPHILRHTFATRLMEITNSRVVQELLGHRSLTSTQIYTHPNAEHLKKAIDRL